MLRGKSKAPDRPRGEPIDLRPAGIRESEHFRHLVERFAGRVVQRAAEEAIIATATISTSNV